MKNQDLYKIFEKLKTGVALVNNESKILYSNKFFKKFLDSQLSNKDKILNISNYKKLKYFELYEHNKEYYNISAQNVYENIWLLEVFDVTIQESEKKDYYYKANFDQLTNLPKRELFNDRAKQVLSMSNRKNENLAIFFIDVDDFKNFNDSYGHDIGDSILKETARRLILSVRESDTVSRWAGDEFTILLPSIGSKNNIDRILNRINDKFNLIHKVNDIDIKISLSIGVVLSPEMGSQLTELIKYADKAMYEAKKVRGLSYHYFT